MLLFLLCYLVFRHWSYTFLSHRVVLFQMIQTIALDEIDFASMSDQTRLSISCWYLKCYLCCTIRCFIAGDSCSSLLCLNY